MKKYVNISSCRRKYLLNHFEEEYPKLKCDKCDNCINNVKKEENTEDLTKQTLLIVELIIKLKRNYGAVFLIQILRVVKIKKNI